MEPAIDHLVSISRTKLNLVALALTVRGLFRKCAKRSRKKERKKERTSDPQVKNKTYPPPRGIRNNMGSV